MTPQLLVVFIAMMIGIQPIATDLYLPALPALTSGLGASVAQGQLTLTALLLPFGVSQLVWGPLSDRFGRRPVVLAGLGSFAVAAAACVVASSIEVLLVWRVVQGIAMGAVVMTGRAVLRDGFAPADAVRVMTKAQTGLGLMACMGPPLGGLLAQYLGWRWAMGAIALFGVAAFTLAVLRFEETLPASRRTSLHPSGLARNWVTVVRHPTFLAGSLLSTLTYASVFTFLATAPFVFIDHMGLSRAQFGLAAFSMSVSYILGTFVCRRLLTRRGLRGTVAVGGVLSLAAGSAMAAATWAGVANLWTALVPMWFLALAHGIHQACGQSAAVAPFPRMAGAASALNGCMMMALAFLVGGWIGRHMDTPVETMTYGIWLWTLPLAAVAWTLMQRHGDYRGA